MRLAFAVLAILVCITAGVVWSLSRTASAIGPALSHIASDLITSTTVKEEHLDPWSPIVFGDDTIGKLVAVARVERQKTGDSILIYRGLLSRAPKYPAESLVAIDSTDDTRFVHELRLIPSHATTSRRWLGTLQFEHTNVRIPVMAAHRP